MFTHPSPALRIAVMLSLLSAFPVNAEERGTPDEAKKMVEEAIKHVAAVGQEKAFADFSSADAKWHNKDVYLFCYKFDGTNTCHGANKALIGKNLIDLKTADGQPLIRNLIDIAQNKGTGWIDYKWTHPVSKKIEDKSSWVARVPKTEQLIGAGIYKQ